VLCSYNLDTIEKAFDVALKLDLTRKMLANAKVWCSKCEGYEHYNYQCPSECQHIRTVSNNDVDNSKVIEDVHVPIKIASIIKDITVDFGTEIFDEIHVSFDSIGDDVNEIVESNIPQCLGNHSSSLMLNIVLWSFLPNHVLVSHLSSLL